MYYTSEGFYLSVLTELLPKEEEKSFHSTVLSELRENVLLYNLLFGFSLFVCFFVSLLLFYYNWLYIEIEVRLGNFNASIIEVHRTTVNGKFRTMVHLLSSD